jgi:lipoprotein-releasing system ATP-binding protein
MLTVSELRKSFLSPTGLTIEVLRSCSFVAAPGEAVAITGVSGAGKSTLLNLIGGLERADFGNVNLNGTAIKTKSSSSEAQLRNRAIGFVFQFHHLLPDLSASENVALPLMIGGSSQRESMQRAKEALEHLGLGSRLDHPVTFLSGGEQQRVAVCRALITQPALVLADEPTGNLDTAIADQISAQLIDYAHEQAKILIVATHSPRLAGMCDRMLLLEEGELKETGR